LVVRLPRQPDPVLERREGWLGGEEKKGRRGKGKVLRFVYTLSSVNHPPFCLEERGEKGGEVQKRRGKRRGGRRRRKFQEDKRRGQEGEKNFPV